MKKVIIVGGGFGGVCAALRLANHSAFKVTLLTKQPYFEYHSALFRSATGRSPLEVAVPLADFFAKDNNITVLQDEVIEFYPDKKTVVGSSTATYHYDYIIFATGLVTDYFGIPGLADLSFGVKTIQEALRLKRRLHEDLNSPQAEQKYVVVGGGATGVELAGELISYLKHIRQRHGVTSPFKVNLIEASPHLLPLLPPTFTKKIAQQLSKIGVQLYLHSPVKQQSLEEINFPDGSIHSHTVIWTAGMTNHPFFAKHANLFEIGKGGRVVVNDYLESRPGVYVIGDSALTTFSGMAQTALHDADFVTTDLKRLVRQQNRKRYQPRRPIYAIPTGPRWSAVLWGNLKVYGYVGWILRRLADLSLYLRFLPIHKALATWHYGFTDDETCPICH